MPDGGGTGGATTWQEARREACAALPAAGLGRAARGSFPAPCAAQKGRPFTCTAASDWAAPRQVLGPADFRALPARREPSPRGEGLAGSVWLGGTGFCPRGKVKVLGMRETRRIYSVTSLDPGRTSRQVSVWGTGPLTPGPLDLGLFTRRPQGHSLPGAPSWPWWQRGTCLPRAPRCYSSSPVPGHLQNPPNSSDLAPPFPPQPLLPETLGQPQNPWVRGEGGPRAVRCLVEISLVLGECRFLSLDPGPVNQTLWGGARNRHFSKLSTRDSNTKV